MENPLISVPVALEVSSSLGKSYITIQKLGAGKKNQINACTMSIEAVAESKYKAAELSEKVKSAMEELGNSNIVFSCELGGERDDTLTATKTYRYESIWNIYY